MFKNATIYRIEGLPTLQALEDGAKASTFEPTGPTQLLSAGWVPPRGHPNGALVEAVNGQWIMKLCIETRSVPTQAVKKGVEKAADLIEKEHGRRPKGKRLKELKDEVIQGLLPKAFPKTKAFTVWVDPKAMVVVVDSASNKPPQMAVLLLQKAGVIKAMNFMPRLSPSVVMDSWLTAGDTGLPNFSIGTSAVLETRGDTGESVAHTNRELDTDEVKEHLRQGYSTTSLQVYWNRRVRFNMGDSSSVLRSIKLLDSALQERPKDGADSFDADAAIYTGELSRLIADFWEALGGEYVQPPPF